MSQLSMNKHLEEDICIHLFTVSAAMVGVCLTVIGLIRVVISLRNMDTLADDLLSVDALFFSVHVFVLIGPCGCAVFVECIGWSGLPMGASSWV